MQFIKIDMQSVVCTSNGTNALYQKSKRYDTKTIFTILSLLFVSSYAQYVPGHAGRYCLRRTIRMPDGYRESRLHACQKPQLPETKQAILYIRGCNDYFFRNNWVTALDTHGYNFYAMDLRKYGRSNTAEPESFLLQKAESILQTSILPPCHY